MRQARAGFTLLEVILAVIILGGGLTVLYRSVIVSARMIALSREREQVAYVFSLADLQYPLRDIEDIEDDAPVDPDGSLLEGYVFERTVDERDDFLDEDVEDDRLYVVRSVVTWDDGRQREEIVRYLRQKE